MVDRADAAPAPPPAPDFFAAQDVARARARRWFVVFALCVVAVVAVIVGYVVVLAAWGMLHDSYAHGRDATFGQVVAALPLEVILGAVVVTLGMILAGCSTRMRELQRGSATLAQSIGARAVPLDTGPPAERQLRNIVEEMSLASGGLAPALFVLDGEGTINAFAGMSAREPFIVVTRGALERLQRDELQGLVAYGIGQLRNGDAVLNVRLIGWLAGITVIADTGRKMMRAPLAAFRGGGDDEGSGDLRKAVLALSIPVALIGGVVMLIGHVGVVLARFVRSLASRQRVYLADATAVQYTRDPVAVRDLLRRVETETGGGTLIGPYREEFGPMLFVPGVHRLCLRTHPKVRQRIARLEQRV